MLCALTGQSTPTAALGVLTAWKADAAQVPALKAQLAEQAASEHKRSRKELLDAACSGEQPVMSPAERASYDSDSVLATLPLEAVRASIEARRASGAVVVKTAPVAPSGGPQSATNLTPEDLHVAELLGVDPKKLAAQPSGKGV